MFAVCETLGMTRMIGHGTVHGEANQLNKKKKEYLKTASLRCTPHDEIKGLFHCKFVSYAFFIFRFVMWDKLMISHVYCCRLLAPGCVCTNAFRIYGRDHSCA